MNAAVVAETIRRHLTSRGYLAFLFFVALAGLMAASFNMPGSLWPTLIGGLAIITGSAIIGPEFSSGALQLIVSRPVRRPVYVLSRAAGVFASVIGAAIVALVVECGTRLIFSRQPVPWLRLGDVFASESMVALLVIAMLTMLGSMTRAYYNVAIYLATDAAFTIGRSFLGMFKMQPNAFGDFLTAHPEVERGVAILDDVLFASAPPVISAMWVLRIAATAAVALTIACLAFERREVPYSAE